MRPRRHCLAGLVALALACAVPGLARVLALPDPIGPSFADRLRSRLADVRARLGL
jgi:hypothetical protein